jgi:hypothetical protein
MGDSTSSYATADIALRVLGVLKSHHHDKVETPSVGRKVFLVSENSEYTCSRRRTIIDITLIREKKQNKLLEIWLRLNQTCFIPLM